MKYFSNNDSIWEDTAAFLAPHISDATLVVGPEDFVNVLPNVMAYDLLGHFTPGFFDFVIVHKGQCLAIGAEKLEAWERAYSAVFANAVFVIFAKHKAQEIDRDSNDFKALTMQISGLPARPTIPHESMQGTLIEDALDYRPTVDFLKRHFSAQTLIVAPKPISALFKNALNEQTVLRTSLDTVSVAVLTPNSALVFPYQDLKNITQNYTSVYSDPFFAIFTKANVMSDSELPTSNTHHGLSEAIISAMENENYLISLKLYRNMVLGK